MKKLLWLDDIRDPTTEKWNNEIAKYIINPLTVKIIWVRNYYEFIHQINTNFPDIISFDHDLSDIHCNKSTYKEKTGMTCAIYLVNYCQNNNINLPQYYIHSSNPVGAENIRKYLSNYIKFKNNEK
jgi:hypothetical protein